MKVSIANRITGYSWLTTEHSASSYGVPVMINSHGEVFGPNDKLFSLDHGTDLDWLNPGINTARDLIEKVILAEEKSAMESQGTYEERVAAAKLFLAGA